MDRGKGRIKQNKDSLYLEFSYQGERFRPTLKGLSASKKAHWKTAESILAEVQVEIARGTFNPAQYFPDYPKSKRFRKGTDILIKDKLNQWIERKRKTSQTTTWKLYYSIIEHHLIPSFGNYSLADLKPNIVREWLAELEIENKTINNALIPLRAIFNEAYEDGLIDENPLKRIKNLKINTKEPDPFTTNERAEILSACEGQLHNIFNFNCWVGLRISELIALRWENVDLTNGRAFIREARTRYGNKDTLKTDNSNRDIELLPPALEALKAQFAFTQGKGHVFHNPVTDKPWNNSDRLKRFWDRILERTSVRYRPPCQMRHTFASTVLTQGFHPMWVASQMGHKDWGMIRKIYGRWIPDNDTTIQAKKEELRQLTDNTTPQLIDINGNSMVSNPVTPTIHSTSSILPLSCYFPSTTDRLRK